MTERQLRHRLARLGFSLRKFRTRTPDHPTAGLYQVLDADNRAQFAGEWRSLMEIHVWMREQEKAREQELLATVQARKAESEHHAAAHVARQRALQNGRG